MSDIDLDALERLAKDACTDFIANKAGLSDNLAVQPGAAILKPATVLALIASAREAELLRARVAELEREAVDRELLQIDERADARRQARVAERAAVVAHIEQRAAMADALVRFGGSGGVVLRGVRDEIERGEHIDGAKSAEGDKR